MHLAGAQVRYDPRAAAGKRVRRIVLQGGRKVRADGEYTLATDEATAEGAGGLSLLAGVRYRARGAARRRGGRRAYLRRLPQPVEAAPAAGLRLHPIVSAHASLRQRRPRWTWPPEPTCAARSARTTPRSARSAEAGAALVTDARGHRARRWTACSRAGSILRVVVRARRGPEDADADA